MAYGKLRRRSRSRSRLVSRKRKIRRALRGRTTRAVASRALALAKRARPEVKLRTFNVVSQGQIYGGGLSVVGVLLHEYGYLIPNLLDLVQITQGASQQQRIGNKISCKSLILSGSIHSNDYNHITNKNAAPFTVYMVAYKRKDSRTDPNPAYIKHLGNNTNGNIDGSVLRSICAPFNKEGYVIKKVRSWSFKGPQFEASLSSASDAIINPNSLNQGKYYHTFRCAIPVSKTLLFSDAQDHPSNDWVSVGFYYVDGNAQGTVGSGTDQIRATINLHATMRYTDA